MRGTHNTAPAGTPKSASFPHFSYLYPMRLRFLYNAGVVLLLNLTVKPFWIFAIDRQVQNQAGPEAYGQYYALLNFSLLLSTLLDAGISNFNTRRVAMQQNEEEAGLNSLLGLKMQLFVGYLVLTMGAAWLSGLGWQPLLLLIGFNQGLHFLNLFLRSYLAGTHQFKTEGFFGVVDKLLMSLLAWPLLFNQAYLTGELMTDFVLIQSLAYMGTTLPLLLLIGRKSLPRLHFSWRFSRSLLRQSLPFALLGLLMAGYTKIDAVLLQNLLPRGDYAAGVYAAGYRLLDAFAMVPILVSGILLPQFASMLAAQKLDAAFVRTAALLLGGLGSLVAVVAQVQADWLMEWLYHHHDPVQNEAFRLLMWTFLPLSLNYVFGTLLTAGGHLKQLNLLATLALLLNLGLNFWLIPQSGPVGAATAALLTQSFMGFAQLLLSWRHYRWQLRAGFVGRLLLWMVVCLVLTLSWPLVPSLSSVLLQGMSGLVVLLLLFGMPLYQRIYAYLQGRLS